MTPMIRLRMVGMWAVAFAIVLLLSVSSCSLFQETPVKPETPKQYLVVAEYSYQQVLKTTNTAIDNNIITPDVAAKLIVAMDGAKASLDAARTAIANGTSYASYVEAAQGFIADVVGILQEQGVI